MFRKGSRTRLLVLAAAALAVGPPGASAQDTLWVVREVHRGPPAWQRVVTFPVRAAKLPLVALGSGLQGSLEFLETRRGPNRLGEVLSWFAAHGTHPRFGGLGDHSGTGGGIRWTVPASAPGPLELEASGTITLAGYMDHRAALHLRPATGLTLALGGRFDRNTRDEFYGIGDATLRASRSDYQREEWSASGEVQVSALSGFDVVAGADWLWEEIERGRNPDVPDTHDAFSGMLIGLEGIQRFFRTRVDVTWDRRQPRGIPERGALISAGVASYDGQRDGLNDFYQIHGEVRGYLPLGGLRRVLALRAATELTRSGPVPFYLLSSLGGGRSLRGFEGGRFHDRDALLLTLEYRYRVWREHRGRGGLDVILFVDEGTVANRLPDDLADARFHGNWGLGLQVATREAPVLRVEFARSDEQTRWLLTAGGRF